MSATFLGPGVVDTLSKLNFNLSLEVVQGWEAEACKSLNVPGQSTLPSECQDSQRYPVKLYLK